MIDIVVLAACIALLLGVGCGLVAHEWSHALVLRLTGVEFDIVYGPSGRDRADSTAVDGPVTGLSRGPWAVVLPNPSGCEPAWHLRAAALMPLTLVIPILALVAIETPESIPDPVVSAAAIGWLACAIPSPQDFSVAFYAHRILESATERGPDVRSERG